MHEVTALAFGGPLDGRMVRGGDVYETFMPVVGRFLFEADPAAPGLPRLEVIQYRRQWFAYGRGSWPVFVADDEAAARVVHTMRAIEGMARLAGGEGAPMGTSWYHPEGYYPECHTRAAHGIRPRLWHLHIGRFEAEPMERPPNRTAFDDWYRRSGALVDAVPHDRSPDDCWRCDDVGAETDVGLCTGCLAALRSEDPAPPPDRPEAVLVRVFEDFRVAADRWPDCWLPRRDFTAPSAPPPPAEAVTESGD